MRANYLMSGVAHGMRRNLLMTIALVLITAVSLVFLGSAFLTSTEISRFRKLYENRLNVSIYLLRRQDGQLHAQDHPGRAQCAAATAASRTRSSAR